MKGWHWTACGFLQDENGNRYQLFERYGTGDPVDVRLRIYEAGRVDVCAILPSGRETPATAPDGILTSFAAWIVWQG